VQPITGIEDLRDALQVGMEIEHATIPAYLCALWTIKKGANPEVIAILREVILQEMLHLTLVANVLNAVGGTPRVADPEFLAHYPTTLPHSDGTILLSLRPFSREAVDTFAKIERPETPGAQPRTEGYHSLGQFYQAVMDEITNLAQRDNIFTGPKDRQIHPRTFFYGASSDTVAVTDLASALDALNLIVKQGEGYGDSIRERNRPVGHRPGPLAHYYRFQEIALGQRYRGADTPETGPTGERIFVDWDAVQPMMIDPKVSRLPVNSQVLAATVACNQTYLALLEALQRGFTGEPEALMDATSLMWRLDQEATGLVHVPLGSGQTAGPSFEWPASVPDGQLRHPGQVVT
jgi:hypothetical protein